MMKVSKNVSGKIVHRKGGNEVRKKSPVKVFIIIVANEI
jgi:hypothetical protein